MICILIFVVLVVGFGLVSYLSVAGTALEREDSALTDGPQGLLLNLEINRSCNLESRCRDYCFIRSLEHKKRTPMSQWLTKQAIKEAVSAGPAARHLAIVGMEPFTTPDLLRHALDLYHHAPEDFRPRFIGAISNLTLAHRCFSWLGDRPFSWLITSLDGPPKVHMRGQDMFRLTWRNLLAVQRIGAAHAVGINTIVTEQNWAHLPELGRMMADNGILYWGLGPMTLPRGSRLTPVIPMEVLMHLGDMLARQFEQEREFEIRFDVEAETFEALTGCQVLNDEEAPWRIQAPGPWPNIQVSTLNKSPSRFLRLRYDGALLQGDETHLIGLSEGRLGAYYPGRLAELLSQSESRVAELTTTRL